MLHIFISYSRQDRDIVNALVQDLRSLGHEVWFDNELTGGYIWWEQILEKIRECDLFMFALSPEALDSYPCKLEYTYASDLHKRILPVLVADGISINLLPPVLAKIQFLDYRQQDRQAAFALSKALNNLPRPQPLPKPLPPQPEVPISYLGNLKDQIETTAPLSFQEQTALLLRLKERLSNVDEFTDVLSLLQRLRNRDDLFAKVANEMNTIIAEAQEMSATGPSVDPAQSGDVSKIEEPKSQERKFTQEASFLLDQSNNKELTRFLIRTYENWLAGVLSFLGENYQTAAQSSSLTKFVMEIEITRDKLLRAALRLGAFAEDEYLVAASDASYLLTNRMLYILTENDPSGPVIPINLREISFYKIEMGWFINTLYISLKSGQQFRFKNLKEVVLEDYVHKLINR